MIDARSRFKEGYIMLKRPFKFHELDRALQQFTVVYAYAEQPKFSYKTDPKVDEKFKEIERTARFRLGDDKEEYLSDKYDELLNTYSDIKEYSGEIVQSIIDGKIVKFFPDEYSIISKEKFGEIIHDSVAYKLDIQDETILYHLEEMIFYAQTRGLDKDTALRMSCFNVKDAIILRPTIHLIDEFCYENKIFYGEKEQFKYRNREWLYFHCGRPVHYIDLFNNVRVGRIEFDNNKYWLPFCGYVNAETVKIYEV